MITHSFFKHGSVNKEGKSKLYLRITIARKLKYYELLYVDSARWDKSKNRMKTVDETGAKINSFLNGKAKEVDNVIITMKMQGVLDTFENFDMFYSRKLYSLFSFFDQVIKKIEKSDFDSGTIRLYRNCIDQLKNYRNNKDIDLSEIDYKFIEGFEMHLRGLKQKTNTRANYLKKFNRVLNDARKEGILLRNPFDNYKINLEKGNRTFLTQEELQKFATLYKEGNLDKSFKNVLEAFIFSCYTGLRHGDVKSIKYSQIRNNIIDKKLDKKTGNGYKRLIVPLSAPARAMIDTNNTSDDLVFPNLISSTKCSPILKAIALSLGINKVVTFHVARHSFATISLGLGIDLKKVSELLGHDSIRTTEIYAHLVEDHLRSAVSKWDNISSICKS